MLHPSFKLTNEIKTNNSLPSLDILLTNLIIDSSLQFIKSLLLQVNIFRDLFGPKQRKTNLIDMLTHQTLKFFFKSILTHELDNICSILVENGYLDILINSRIFKKLSRFLQDTEEGPKMSFLLKITMDG